MSSSLSIIKLGGGAGNGRGRTDLSCPRSLCPFTQGLLWWDHPWWPSLTKWGQVEVPSLGFPLFPQIFGSGTMSPTAVPANPPFPPLGYKCPESSNCILLWPSQDLSTVIYLLDKLFKEWLNERKRLSHNQDQVFPTSVILLTVLLYLRKAKGEISREPFH